MVRKFLPVFFLLCTSAVFSESPWGSSIQKGLETAKQDKKFIIVDVFADWCTYCLVLEKEIFPDPEVSRVLESFVKVRLDGEEFPNLRKKYNIEGYPTILFLDGDGNYVTKISGLATKEDILGVSKRILQEPNLESYLKTELRRNTNSPDIHFRLGLLYFQNKEFEKAEQQFSDAVQKSKNQTILKENAHFNLNLVRSIHGPKESAVKSWKEFLDTYPTSSRKTTAKLYYGLTLKDAGESKLAKVVLMEIKPQLTTETDKSMCNEALSEIERGF
ncbi:thioredoxin fold domain-containing protein [Leptospira bandrabouensis]|uniref:thioredoxin fold domain-containing protein n=1 Tax=Leptospira bandrabouensis TaxID=2484903 RepID=UPI00223D7FE0|nr:thioredoxin fold domain-containing protein [Leptospira bandrabouensis]MCW7459763.1 thioredoxin fold domain-containing protein [Leptospira bandrabouensis]MCW7477124.1 thioredoxin fold domain-containing protein [Leptospira bandrabouensis]MCW7484806.1 thioredoxin fold domain-containing protein [Leptospira bandrabouensis]